MFGPFLFYLKAVLMTKDLSDVLFPEFKKELGESEYAKSQTKLQKKSVNRNRMAM